MTDNSTDLPVIPQGIKIWSVGKESASYTLEPLENGGPWVTVPMAVYRIWESGFLAGVLSTTKEEEP